MWLAHHPPDHYERCVLIGRSYVCRRCLVLYPVTFAAMALAVLWPVPVGIGDLAIVLLPLPGVIELVAEQLGALDYWPRRQIAVTVPLAVGLGVGLARYLDDHGDRVFWVAIALYTLVCFAAVSWRQRRDRSV
jgi:hypothetical protein